MVNFPGINARQRNLLTKGLAENPSALNQANNE